MKVAGTGGRGRDGCDALLLYKSGYKAAPPGCPTLLVLRMLILYPTSSLFDSTLRLATALPLAPHRLHLLPALPQAPTFGYVPLSPTVRYMYQTNTKSRDCTVCITSDHASCVRAC